MKSLVGRWTKISREPCSSAYPATLEFLPDGTYRGAPADEGGYAVWDVGSYEAAGPGRVRISTAWDERIVYGMSGSGDDLALEDPDGCVVRFRFAAG